MHPLKKPIRIVADDRERSTAVLAALHALDGVSVVVRRLDIGDYAVGRNLIVERKTTPDFVQSVCSGRLFRQANRLSKVPGRYRFVILEGSDSHLRTAGLSLHALHGALLTVTLVFGLPVIRTLDPAETAHLLVVAGRQLHRRAIAPSRLHPSRLSPARSTQLLMLLAIREIGPFRATALLERFGSIRALAAASVDELAAVPGVGVKTARRLRWALKCNSCRNTNCSGE